MRFVSRFMDREPFSTLRRRDEDFIQKQPKKVEKKSEKFANADELMYNYDTFGVMKKDTDEYYTGKFAILGDKLMRIVKVINGQEVSNVVKDKNSGEIVSLEIVGHEPKKYKTQMTPETLKAEIDKMSVADQNFYDELVNNYTNSTFVAEA